ncbi:MAG: flavodoxin protein [Pseudonocardia sp.]|nr:flavodoxin protein [Pseudonocardia sp.]
MHTFRSTSDVTVLNDHAEVPGLGFLPVNAFVVHAAEPVVVDTGLSTPDVGFLDALSSVVDPADVRWIWLTHPDRDHTGALFELLEAAPQAKIVTTFLGVGIMSTESPLPLNRVHLLNPGQSLDVGDRTLTAFRPPLFDSPATTGFFDSQSGVCISSDCFGAPLPSVELASAEDVAATPDEELIARQLLWTTVDSPWVHNVDPEAFERTFEPLRTFAPSAIFSTHLPPATGRLDEFLDNARRAPSATPFVGPDQEALNHLLSQFEPQTV